MIHKNNPEIYRFSSPLALLETTAAELLAKQELKQQPIFLFIIILEIDL
jgi:hypothetical protein